MLAKREHAKNLPPLLVEVLKQADMFKTDSENIYDISYISKRWQEIEKIVSREKGLYEGLKKALDKIKKPGIDVIAVTSGPGLAPALWVGISFANALGKLWDIPVIGINHMEGHIASVLMSKTEEFSISNFQFSKNSNAIQFPALALLISGGHTELVDIQGWGKYKIIGQTLDDAVGEAFDKAARMMGLPYPGGPQISSMAEKADKENLERKVKLPRPMIHSSDLNFSFSGLKTAVLYHIRDYGLLSENDKADLAREFEEAVTDVLLNKTKKALKEVGAKTLIIAGGVISNKKLRSVFSKLEKEYLDLKIRFPSRGLSTDNSVMIAYAGYINVYLYPKLLSFSEKILAEGNLKLKSCPQPGEK